MSMPKSTKPNAEIQMDEPFDDINSISSNLIGDLKLTQPEEPNSETPDPLILILQTAKAKQQAQLDDLQTTIDALSEDFATCAAAIVETGLRNSYQLARQKIGAIDIRFFDLGENLPNASPLRLPEATP
jgi:hypothetical protein